MPLPDISPEEYLSDLERARLESVAVANRQFEALRVKLLAREAERKKLWGNRYPFVYTTKLQPPPDATPTAPKRKAKKKAASRKKKKAAPHKRKST